MIGADQLLDAGRPLADPRAARIAVDVIGRKNLVRGRELTAVAHLVDEAARKRELVRTRKGGGKLGRVGMLPEADDLAVLQREDMRPFGRDRPSGPLDLHRVAAKHKDLVVGGVEFARRKFGEILVLGDAPEEFLDLLDALAGTKCRKVALPPNRLPVDLRIERCKQSRDVAAPKRGIKVLDEGDTGVAHEFLPSGNSVLIRRPADKVSRCDAVGLTFASDDLHPPPKLVQIA